MKIQIKVRHIIKRINLFESKETWDNFEVQKIGLKMLQSLTQVIVQQVISANAWYSLTYARLCALLSKKAAAPESSKRGD